MSLFSRKKTKSDASAGAGAGTEVVLLVEGMHCTSCGLLIDDELEELPGVRSSSTDTRAGRTVVRLEEGAAVETAALVAAVEEAGEYKARPAA
ncbi:heavy metal-associated domain-containing protein [Streptomyces sp. H27-D2]|uniref:heavy metal-associated domain-containing protein n=1 Tax=Streptomyces sp. H27-D2 TaxID=3046304 RepID=UPI002DB8572D|nr:heavy metal-associated domain-containing protein [Streptomyces sp. H27-D2]MEC4018499.1 heavy metal-associated domain-containing protein [Streptomyces sp. H27-D2]